MIVYHQNKWICRATLPSPNQEEGVWRKHAIIHWWAQQCVFVVYALILICDEMCLQSWPEATAALETKEDGLPPSCLTTPDTSSPLLWHPHPPPSTHTHTYSRVQGSSTGVPSVSLVSSGPCLQWLWEVLQPQVVPGPAHPSRGARPGHMVCGAQGDTQGRQLPSATIGQDRQQPQPTFVTVCWNVPFKPDVTVKDLTAIIQWVWETKKSGEEHKARGDSGQGQSFTDFFINSKNIRVLEM